MLQRVGVRNILDTRIKGGKYNLSHADTIHHTFYRNSHHKHFRERTRTSVTTSYPPPKKNYILNFLLGCPDNSSSKLTHESHDSQQWSLQIKSEISLKKADLIFCTAVMLVYSAQKPISVNQGLNILLSSILNCQRIPVQPIHFHADCFVEKHKLDDGRSQRHT